MADRSDSLDISSIRLRKEYPKRPVEVHGAHTPEHGSGQAAHAAGHRPDGVKRPAAAAAARARIAEMGDYQPVPELHPAAGGPTLAPAISTADLVTDKAKLAGTDRDKPLVHRRRIPSAVLPFVTAVGVFLLVLLLFKAPVIISQIQYSLSNKNQAPVAAAPAAAEVVPAENTITIAKINVHAPVEYEPSIQEAAIQRALQDGVVHYGNTATPGQNGNVAIFGHSSNDWWEPGNFKFVFVLLDKLAPGDQVTIDFQSHRYVYEVTGSRVVEPTDVGVLNATPTPTLTLITCTPPGTSLKRLVVTAKQVSPVPGTTKPAPSTPTAQPSAPSTLSSSSNFLDSLSQAWNGIFSSLSSIISGKPAASPTPTPAATGQLPAIK